MEPYNGYLDRLSKKIENRLSEISAVYNFDFGDEFELALCNILRDIFPMKYGICRGFVQPMSGKPVGDDIIVFNQERFPTIRSLEKEDYSQKEYIPLEAVYAYVEAKHTIVLDGSGSQSLKKAFKQVSDVKALPREGVPLNRIAPYLNTNIPATRPEYWPRIHNPMYGVIWARYVKEKPNDDPISSFNELKQVLDGRKVPNTKIQPDMIVVGKHVVFLPTVEQTYYTPFVYEKEPRLSFFHAPNRAFAVAICNFLFALDTIRLDVMPWREIFTPGLDVEVRGKKG